MFDEDISVMFITVHIVKRYRRYCSEMGLPLLMLYCGLITAFEASVIIIANNFCYDHNKMFVCLYLQSLV